MKFLKVQILSTLFILLFAGNLFAQSATAEGIDFFIQIYGFNSTGDRFMFTDHTGATLIFEYNQTKAWGKFQTGSSYSLTQSSEPRPCRITNGSGTVPGSGPVTISVDCTARYVNFSISISGFRSTGDRFVFKDHRNTTHTFDANGTKNWGSFVAGTGYSLTQTSGPRQCRITNGNGTVPGSGTVTATIDCNASTVNFSISISGFTSLSDRFVFTDHRNTALTFDQNETRDWGAFVVGTNYSLTQTSGPRPCSITNGSGTVPGSGTVNVTINCAGRTSNYSIASTGIGSGETFDFKDQRGFFISLTTNGMRAWGSFPVGSKYSLTQTNGPRQCTLTNNQGTVQNSDVTINIDCPPQTSTFNIDITGIGSGETFNFRDHRGHILGLKSSGIKPWGAFPVGSSYSLTQSGGPRNCRITGGSGTVSAANVTVTVDCNIPPPSMPAKPLKFTISGVQQGETFTFKDGGNRNLTFNTSSTQELGLFLVGSNYSYTQAGGPRQCRMTNNQGVMRNSETTIIADCSRTNEPTTPTTPTPTTPTTTGRLGDFDLVSRSTDQKSFGGFSGSVNASIGGLDGVGEKEGQFVAYMTSWNVDPKHGGKNRQIIWFNRGNRRAAVASLGLDGFGANKDSYEPVIDVTGMNVAFESTATNIVEGDTNNASDIFIFRVVPSSEASCVTCNGNAASYSPSLSRHGAQVAFVSNASNLAPGVDGTSTGNVYVKDTGSGQVTLISKDPKTGKGLGGRHPSISEDGSRIAFYSFADKLVDNDTNKLWDIFVWDRGNSKLKRISLTADGQERDQGTESVSRIVKPTISGNGKYVAYATTASNMGGAATGRTQQVYVVELDTGRVIRVSEGIEGAGNADSPIEQGEKIALSYDGKWVAFSTRATNLGGKVIVKNIDTGETHTFAKDGAGGTPWLSRDGKCVVFPASERLDKRFDSNGIFTTCRQN